MISIQSCGFDVSVLRDAGYDANTMRQFITSTDKAMRSIAGNELDIEISVMRSLFSSTGGTSWVSKEGWESLTSLDGGGNSSSSVPNRGQVSRQLTLQASLRKLFGLSADGNGRVSRLVLAANGLRGCIPPSIGSLCNLTHLVLNGNRLQGKLKFPCILLS